ncbi:MAG: hypothetical protein M5U12_15310 [Verrucomicrobia bacterium]|nr:hypothetical protein [Verrucomicrobiota bacterium]
MLRASLLFLPWLLLASSTPPTLDPLGPAPTLPAVPDVTLSLLRIAGALILVLALFFVGAWLFRNWQRGLGRPDRPPASTCSNSVRSAPARPLRRRLRTRTPPRRFFPNGVTLVDRLPRADEADTPPAAPPASFGDTLRQLLQPR